MPELTGEAAMPGVILPDTRTPPPQMDVDDLPPQMEMIVDSATDEQSRLSKQKLMDTLSFSFPAGSLTDVLAKVRQDDDLLSQSCFSQIRLDKGGDEFEDDELTSLDWLQDRNLLKNIGGTTRLMCPSPNSSDDEFSDLDSELGKENETISVNSSLNSGSSPLPHPSHIPYNPQKHVNSKPPYSFSCLIFMAIEDSPEKKLPVKEIYSWILGHFPYYQQAPTGWKNSVRHNLSLNKCFSKVEKDKASNIGKGSYWCVDQSHRVTLLQALRRTPYHPYHQLQMMSVSPISRMTPQKFPFIQRFGSGNKNLSPQLFPFLSRRLNNSQADSLENDIDVANALVALKKSPLTRSGVTQNGRMRSLKLDGKGRSRSPSPPEFGSREDRARTTHRSRRATSPIIITEVPTIDHTYSASTVPKGLIASPGSSIVDCEYEFHDVEEPEEGEELVSGDEFDSAEEEEMSMEVDSGKEMDGVNALLNLASIATSVMSDITNGSATAPPINTISDVSTTASRPNTTASKPSTAANKDDTTNNRPSPATSKSSSATSKPRPATSKPSPATSKSSPATSKPSPTTSKSIPATSKPSPTTSKPSPTTSKSIPATSKPSPTTSKSIPATSKPSPKTSKPNTTSSKAGTTTSRPNTTSSRAGTTTSRGRFVASRPNTRSHVANKSAK